MKTIETEILVIGAGSAGCRASIAARRSGAQTLLVSKGPQARSGLTPTTSPGFAISLGTCDPEDNPEMFAKDIIKAGHGLNNRKVVKAHCEKGPQEVAFLGELGIRFDLKEDGTVLQTGPGPGHSYKRSVKMGHNMGRTILNALSSEMGKSGVNLLEDVMISELLVIDDRVIGAIGIDISRGECVCFLAKAVILATGGAGALYWPFTSNDPRSTGDGYALALRAGAELTGLEFMQFNPYMIVHPISARGTLMVSNTPLIRAGAKYKNKFGEAFMERYDPRKEMATRDVTTRAMFIEIVEGRGSEHGGVYLDCSEVKTLPFKDIFESAVGQYLINLGMNEEMLKMPELAPGAHFMCGGVIIDERAETSIKGLFACGEVAGGLHGANRLGSNAMPETLTYGGIAGENAAAYGLPKKKEALTQGLKNLVEKKERKLFKVLEKGSGKVYAPQNIKEDLTKIMFEKMGLIRKEEGLRQANVLINKIKKEALPKVAAKDRGKIYNYDWIEILELLNMMDVAHLMVKAATMRTETRGMHYRKDFPQKDEDHWLKNIIMKKGQKGLQIRLLPPVME